MEDSRIDVRCMGEIVGVILYKDGKFSGRDEGGVKELNDFMSQFANEEEGTRRFLRFLSYASPSYVTYEISPL